MKFKRHTSGLITPVDAKSDSEVLRESMPQFRTYMFEIYREQDVDKFKKLVESKKGYFIDTVRAPSVNYKNQQLKSLGGNYICIYQFHEPISMELLC